MNSDNSISEPGDVVRVYSTSNEGKAGLVEYRDGRTASVRLGADSTIVLERGSVLFINSADNDVRLLPTTAWSSVGTSGIVRRVTSDVALVEVGNLIAVAHDPPEGIATGNTVEWNDRTGITNVLDELPIRAADSDLSEEDIARFEIPKEKLTGSFADIGGYSDVVRRAKELVEMPLLKREELRKIGSKAVRGVLFTGPPGTGKTMVSKAIAGEAGVSFFMIDGPEIFSKWYGQSGEILRKVFESASQRGSAIIFIDEIDSVAGARGDDSHEESRRVVAQLLTLMDGFDASSNVVVVAATNRPGDLDPALRRPGRFDWEIEFGLPSDGDRVRILDKCREGHKVDADLNASAFVEVTEGWTPAELNAIWSEAALVAVADEREKITQEDLAIGHERASQHRKRQARARRREEPRRT